MADGLEVESKGEGINVCVLLTSPERSPWDPQYQPS